MHLTSEIARRLRHAGRYRRALHQKPLEATVRQDGKSAVIKAGNKEIFFRGRDLEVDRCQTADFALIALQVIALSRGKNFNLDAPVTASSFRVAQRYRALWRNLVPGRTYPGRVTCSQIIADPPARQDYPGILCLSGGVDSTYAALTHQQEYREALLIRGADYPVSGPSGFDTAAAKAARTAAALQMSFNIVETNLKEHLSNWELFHTGFLTACLSFVTGGEGRVAWASDLTPSQELLSFPWGNMQGVSDVLSSARLKISQLDKQTPRSGKILSIVRQASWLVPNITGCYDSAETGHNCGQCRKCMWTKVALAGLSDPQQKADAEIAWFGSVSDPLEVIANIPTPPKNKVGSWLLRISDVSENIEDPIVLQALDEMFDRIVKQWHR